MSEQPWLIPEIEQEIRDDRSAIARQAAQRVRKEKRMAVANLRKVPFTKLVDRLLEKGPATEARLLFELFDESTETEARKAYEMLVALWSLWRIGKLWRKSMGIHEGSGEQSFLYGIRKVHPQP